jgi:paraquat-inducible protein B
MSERDEGIRPEPGELPQPEVKRSRAGISLIWLVPIVAALVGISLLVNHYMSAGPKIEVTFQTAEGIEVGKTQVKYKNVVIGKVSTMRLSRDRTHVNVGIELNKDAQAFATQGTRYWVVRPRIGTSGVSGVDTLLSGAFIGADAGASDQDQREFKGLENPPAVTHGAPGRRFKLHADDLGSLDIGSPVYFRRIQVGRIVSFQLDKDGKGVSLELFVDGPNDRFVLPDSRFWNASGVDVSLGADGLKMNTQSLATVIAGGVAFQDPPGPHDESPAPEMKEYTLFADQQTAVAPPDGKPYYFRMRFAHSMRGLSVDAPVEMLGVKVGKVVSVKLDYDPSSQTFPVVVGALVYPQRLGAAYEKLAKALGGGADDNVFPRVMQDLVQHGVRAQARTGNLLTGQLYIALDFDKKAPKATLDPNAKPIEVPTVGGDFDHLQEQITSIVDKVEKIPFDSIGRNLDGSLQELHGTLKQVNGEVMPQVRKTLEGIDKTVGSANDALSENSPLQTNIAGTLEELQRTVRSVRAFVDYLERHPEALLRGRGADAPPRIATPPKSTQGKEGP